MENSIQIEKGYDVIKKLPALLEKYGPSKRILLVSDNRTVEVGGRQAEAVLASAGWTVESCVLSRQEALVPDERAADEIEARMGPDPELLLAVGSGSINDLAKYAAKRAEIPYAVVPTAPSMDGYASSVTALTMHGFKQTLPAAPPVLIAVDPAILATAPMTMFLAGMGDVLGKYTALADWKLASIIEQEEYSDAIAAEVRQAVDRVNAIQPGMDKAEMAMELIDALILSGEAMLRWGNSRPASGSEHHLAHFWEMRFALDGREGPLHGTKVGVAVLLTTGIYRRLFSLSRDEVAQKMNSRRGENEAVYRKRVEGSFGCLAEGALAEQKGYYLDEAKRRDRQERILARWDMMREWVGVHVPDPERLRNAMKGLGAAVTPSEIGIGPELLALSLGNAKEVRRRYTVFRLAEDIGWEL